jgi:hypothetical protein
MITTLIQELQRTHERLGRGRKTSHGMRVKTKVAAIGPFLRMH